MELADIVFKRKTYDESRLTEYGFKKEHDTLIYTTPILDGQFLFTVNIVNDSITTDVIELSLNEPFALYHIDEANGAFVGQIRSEAEKILSDIASKCFVTRIFKTAQAKMCIKYIQKKYDSQLEFLWQKFPDNAIWRRSDNGKWYGALLTVSAKKLNINSDETVEIIDLRMNPADKEILLDGKNFLEGYHMNKNSWFTVILDGRVPDDNLQKLIDNSFVLAKKK